MIIKNLIHVCLNQEWKIEQYYPHSLKLTNLYRSTSPLFFHLSKNFCIPIWICWTSCLRCYKMSIFLLQLQWERWKKFSIFIHWLRLNNHKWRYQWLMTRMSNNLTGHTHAIHSSRKTIISCSILSLFWSKVKMKFYCCRLLKELMNVIANLIVYTEKLKREYPRAVKKSKQTYSLKE